MDSDQLVYLRSLIIIFTVHFLIAKYVKLLLADYKDYADAQADLILHWTGMPEDRFITKTCLYSFDSLKPHFYRIKMGFTGVYISFLISAQKHRLWYSLEPPHRGGSNEYPQSMF